MVPSVNRSRLLSHEIGPGALNFLRVVSLVDALLLVVLLWASLNDRDAAVGVLGPLHGILFLVLVGTLARFAGLGRARWAFTAAVFILGPLASVPGLELMHRSGRAAPSG